MTKGARNPKTVRLSVAIDDGINERINRLADVTGTNKGTIAAFTLAAGLTALEAVMLPPDAERQADVAMHLARKVQRDVKDTAEKHELGFKPKSEEEALPAWVPSQGYMAGL